MKLFEFLKSFMSTTSSMIPNCADTAYFPQAWTATLVFILLYTGRANTYFEWTSRNVQTRKIEEKTES